MNVEPHCTPAALSMAKHAQRVQIAESMVDEVRHVAGTHGLLECQEPQVLHDCFCISCTDIVSDSCACCLTFCAFVSVHIAVLHAWLTTLISMLQAAAHPDTG